MRSGPGIGPIRWRRRLLWTIWVNAARKRCPPPRSRSQRRTAGASSSRGRRESLSGCRSRALWPELPLLPRGSALTSRAKPFDGITIQFAKAPFGTDEKDVDRQADQAVGGQDRREGRAHDRPVERRGRDVRDELRGAEPVRRELPDEHRPDRSRHQGRARGAEHEAVARQPELRVDQGEVHPQHDHEEHVQGEALRPPVHHRRHRHLLQQGPAGEGQRRQHPADRARAHGRRGEDREARQRHLGPQRPAVEQGLHLVLPLPRAPQPRRRHHLEGPVEGHLQQRRRRPRRCSSTPT